MTGYLQITAAGWVLLSFGHTMSAKDWQSGPKFNSLPAIAKTCARAGWYQGSGFFIMNALLNYAWSQNPALLAEPIHKAIAAVMISIIGVSSAWYSKQGVMPNAFATGMIAILQGYSAFLA